MVLGLLAAGAAIAAGAAMNDAQSPKNNDQSWNPKGTGYTDAESLSMRVTQYITQGGRPEYQNATSHPKTLSVYNEPYAKQNGNEYGTFEFYKAPDGTFTRDLTRATDISFDNKSGKVTLTLPDKWANDEVIKKITDSYSLQALSKNYKTDKDVQYQDPYDETKKINTEKYIEMLNSALKDRTTALEATAPTKANLIGRFGGSDKRNKVINGLTADDVIVMSADGNSEKTPLAIPKWMEVAYPELTRLISYKNGFVKPEDFRNEFYNIEKGKITESQANAITETVRRMLSEDVDDMTPEEYARTLALYNYLAKHDPVRSGWQQFISAGDSMAKQFYSGYYNNMYDWVTGTADLLVNAANFSWATGNNIDLYDTLQQENDFGRALEDLATQDYEINSRINFNSLSASDAARLQANILAKATQTVATMAAFQYVSGAATNAIIKRGATKLAERMVSGGAASTATGVATAGQTAAFNQAAGQTLKQAISKASASQLTQRFFSMTGEQLRNAYNLAVSGTGAALNGMSITQMTNVVNSAVTIANSAKWANTALNALSMVTLSAVVWNQDLTRKVMSSKSTSEETALWIRQTLFDTAKMAGFSALGNVATNELIGAYKGSKLETAVEGFKQAASKKAVGISSKISAPWLKFRKWWLSRKIAMGKQVSNATATSYEAVREAELLNEARVNLAAKSTTPPNQMTDIAANMGVPPVSASAQVVDPVSGLVKTGVMVNGAVGTITPYQEGQADLVELENQLTDWSDVDTNVSVVMHSITHPDIEPVMSQQVSEAMKADSELLRLEEEAGLLDKDIIKANKKLGKEEYNFIYSSHSQASAIYATRSWELQIIKNEALANGTTLETYKPYLEAKDRLAKAAENLPANIRLVIDNKVIPSFQRIEHSLSSRMTYDWHVFPEDVLNGLRADGKWGTEGKDWLRTVARKDLPKGTYTPYSKVVQRDNTLSLNRFRILEDDDITWIGNGLSELIRESAIANAERGFLKSSIKATGITPEVVVSGEKTAAARSLKEYRTELNKEIGNGIRSFKEDMKMSEGVAKKTDLAKNLAKEEVATTGGVEITEPEELKVVMEEHDVLTTSSIVDQQSMNEFYNQSSPEAKKIMQEHFGNEIVQNGQQNLRMDSSLWENETIRYYQRALSQSEKLQDAKATDFYRTKLAEAQETARRKYFQKKLATGDIDTGEFFTANLMAHPDSGRFKTYDADSLYRGGKSTWSGGDVTFYTPDEWYAETYSDNIVKNPVSLDTFVYNSHNAYNQSLASKLHSEVIKSDSYKKASGDEQVEINDLLSVFDGGPVEFSRAVYGGNITGQGQGKEVKIPEAILDGFRKLGIDAVEIPGKAFPTNIETGVEGTGIGHQTEVIVFNKDKLVDAVKTGEQYSGAVSYDKLRSLIAADSAKTIKKTRKEWKENPIYDEDYSAGRAEDVMEGRIPLEDYLEEQKERMWEAFKKSNQGTETFYHRDENGQIDRRDTVSYNGTLYRGLYSEYGGKPTKAEFGEAFDDVIKKGSESKYYSGFKEFDYDGDFDRGYNAGNEEIDNILSIKATAEPAPQKAIIETSEQHFDVVSYDKLQRLIASDEANNDFSHIGILDRIDKANALASEKVKSSSQIKEASEQYSQLQKEMQRDANGIEDYSYMAVDKSASPLQKFVDENKLALPNDKRPLKGKVKHALWEKVQNGEELPKIKGIKKSDISKEMDKKDFYKMLDETDLFKNASGPNPLKYDLDEEKLLGDVDKSIDGMIDFVKTNKKASLAVEGIANLQGVPMTDTRFEFIVLDNILNKEGESIFGKTLYDVSKNIVDENIPKTAVVIKGNLDTLYGKVNKAIKNQMISRFAAAKNALESAGEAVDSATVTQLLDKYNEEIVGAKTDPVVVKTTNDKGEIEFLRVSPTIADIYNNRPIYTPMSTPMQLMANMALLKRISITNLNPRSFSKQAASDTAMAFATVGAFPGTFNAIGDDLSLRFGNDIAEYFKQNDPTRFENIKAIADRDGITLAEAAVKNSEAIGNVQLPFNTMNQEALKQANVGKYGTKQAIEMRRKTAIQKMNDGLRKASDKLGKPNDKREEYARKLAGQKAYRDALDKGYNPEQADQFRRQAIDNATTNFRQKHTVFNNLRITTPYLTSGISGAKSFWKMFELDPIGVTSRIFTGFIVPIMYFMGEIVKDEELRKKYESLAEYEKANHIIIAINGDLIGIPVGEELGQITNIVSHIVESMHGENQYNFWNLMLNDVVGLLPGADLTGFTDPEMWDNISGQAPSFLEVMDNGISSVLSSTMPPLAQSLYMATSGRDLYTGKRIDTSKVSLDADGNPVIQSYTQSQFAKAMSNIIGGDARVIEKVTSGLFGTTALHVLDTITSAVQFVGSGGQEGSLTTAVEKAVEDITKPYALNGYSGLDKRFLQEVRSLEEKKRDIEHGDPQRNLYMKYNQEIAKETDPKKRQELINKRNGLLSEYQKQVEQLIKSYRSKGGSLDRYKFSLVTGLLTFEDAIRADRTFLPLNTESSNAEAQALATLYSYGVTNPDAPSSLGYIYFDKDGNAQLKMWTPSQMKIVNDSFYAQGDIHTAQIKAIIDDRTDNSLSNQLKAERKAEDPYWNKAKMTDDDYDAIDDLRKAYNAKVVLALEDYMNTYGAANVLSNDAVMDYLNDIIRVPSSYEKVKGRFVSSDNGKLNKQTGFAESYIKKIFGVK